MIDSKPSNAEYLRTDYYVYASANCNEHGEHSLGGRAAQKKHMQQLIKAVVDDLPFFEDLCELGDIKGVLAGQQDVYTYTEMVNGKLLRRVWFDTREDINKVYVTKKATNKETVRIMNQEKERVNHG